MNPIRFLSSVRKLKVLRVVGLASLVMLTGSFTVQASPSFESMNRDVANSLVLVNYKGRIYLMMAGGKITERNGHICLLNPPGLESGTALAKQ